MSKHMSRKVLLTIGLALVLAVGGLTTASNMGFKLNKTYLPGGTVSGNNPLSLPYFQTQFPFLHSLYNDIPNASRVCLVQANYSPTCWQAGNGNVLAITPGAGLIVNLSGGSAQSNIIVGSHDPALALTLLRGSTATANNVVSIPYHATYQFMHEIYNDLLPNVSRVCQIQASYSPSCWQAGNGNILPVVIGQAVLININGSGTQLWTPDHY